jgi:hypothetical protein
MTLRGTTLVGSGLCRTPLCRATGVAAKDRAPPCNGGDSGAAYWVFRLFGARLTDPFGATGAPGLHHPPDRSARVWRRLLAPIDVDTLFDCRPTVAVDIDTVNRMERLRTGGEALRIKAS